MADGRLVDGANCTLTNDHGTTIAESGVSSPVRRSSKDLEINCASPGQPDAGARLLSRANAGVAGNIILGGAVGAIIDHNSGAAYTYPSWVRIVFGEFAVLDRREEVEGQVLRAGPGSAARIVRSSLQPAVVGAATASATGRLKSAPSEGSAGPLSRGQTLEYRLTDRYTGKASSVRLRVDRVSDSEILFNSGARIERPNGEVLQSAAMLGELDAVTPPSGWTAGGRVPRGMWPVRFINGLTGGRSRYDLMASAGPEGTIRTAVGDMRAVRIDLEGWIERIEGFMPVKASYRATLWLSTELGRPIRFEATSRAGGNAGGAAFAIDEILELVAIQKD